MINLLLYFNLRARALRACAYSLCISPVISCACCLVKDMFQISILSISALNAKIAAAFNGRRFGLRAPKAIETSHYRFAGFWITQGDPKPVKRCAFVIYSLLNQLHYVKN